jgi:hypothetical protein
MSNMSLIRVKGYIQGSQVIIVDERLLREFYAKTRTLNVKIVCYLENEVRFTRTNDKAVFLIRDVGMFLFSNLVGISGWKIRLKSFIGIFLIGIIEVRLVDGW